MEERQERNCFAFGRGWKEKLFVCVKKLMKREKLKIDSKYSDVAKTFVRIFS